MTAGTRASVRRRKENLRTRRGPRPGLCRPDFPGGARGLQPRAPQRLHLGRRRTRDQGGAPVLGGAGEDLDGELGATQQYYPVLHSAFWLEHRLWGDAAVGYHLAERLPACRGRLPLCPRPAPARRARAPAGGGDFRAASPRGRIRGLDLRGEEYAFPRVLPAGGAGLPALRGGEGRARRPARLGHLRAGHRPVPSRAPQQERHRHAAGGAPRRRLVAARPAFLAAGDPPAPALARLGRSQRPADCLGRAALHRGRRLGLLPRVFRALPPRRAGDLVLSGEARLAGRPDVHLSTVEPGGEPGALAWPSSWRRWRSRSSFGFSAGEAAARWPPGCFSSARSFPRWGFSTSTRSSSPTSPIIFSIWPTSVSWRWPEPEWRGDGTGWGRGPGTSAEAWPVSPCSGSPS